MIPIRLPGFARIALRHQFALGSLAVLLIGFVLLIAMAGVLPPGAVRSVRLDAVAAALRGPTDAPLIREVLAIAPDSDRHWLDAPDARQRLAALLRVPVADVRMLVAAPIVVRPIATAMVGGTVVQAAFLPLSQENVAVAAPPVLTTAPIVLPSAPLPAIASPERPSIKPSPPPRRAAPTPAPARSDSLPRAPVAAPAPRADAVVADIVPAPDPRPAVPVIPVPPRPTPAARRDDATAVAEISGPFRAALRIPTGGWAVVHPADEPFPNTAQQRMLLWFLVTLAIAGPLAWLTGLVLTRPLRRFAEDIDRAGRDPSAALPSDGPVELTAVTVGLARMRARVRTFAADRTALTEVLRTDLHAPLERLRAIVDDAPRSVRDAFNDDLIDIENAAGALDMFLRDADEVGPLIRHDLSRIARDVAKSAAERGMTLHVDAPSPLWIDGDEDALSRAIDLLARHVRGGQGGTVSLRLAIDDRVAVMSAVRAVDAAPAFAPGLRAKAEVANTAAPSGGELAVVRSIARSHRGALRLLRTDQGMMIQMGLPLARK